MQWQSPWSLARSSVERQRKEGEQLRFRSWLWFCISHRPSPETSLSWFNAAVSHDCFGPTLNRIIVTLNIIKNCVLVSSLLSSFERLSNELLHKLFYFNSVFNNKKKLPQPCFLGTASGGFCVMFMKIKVEWHSIIFVNMGSLIGLVFGKTILKL